MDDSWDKFKRRIENVMRGHGIILKRSYCLLLLMLVWGFSYENLSANPRQDDTTRTTVSTPVGKGEADRLLQRGIEYSYADSLEKGVDYLKQALKAAEKTKDKKTTAIANYYLGDLYFQFDDYTNAQIYWQQTYNLSESLRDYRLMVYSITGLGNIYMSTNDWKNAGRCLKQGLTIAQERKLSEDIPKIYNQLGNLYSMQSNHDSAMVAYTRMLESGLKVKDSTMIGFAYVNISNLLLNQQRPREAIRLLKDAMQMNAIRTKPKAWATVKQNIGKAYLLDGRIPQALNHLEEAFALATQQGYLSLMVSSSQSLSKAYEAAGNQTKALEYYKTHSTIKDSVFTIEKQKQLQNMQLMNQLEQTEKQLMVLHQKAFAKNLLVYFSLFTLVLLFIIFYLINKSIRNKVRLQELEKVQLSDTIDQQNRDLVSMAINLAKKQEIISEISSSTISYRQMENSDVMHLVENIHEKIKDDQLLERKWELFKKHFAGVHPSFFSGLQEKHPELTSYELRYCAFLKLNLSAKDIAQINNISLRSVYMFRYRLKKKLHLKEEDDLDQYIHHF